MRNFLASLSSLLPSLQSTILLLAVTLGACLSQVFPKTFLRLIQYQKGGICIVGKIQEFGVKGMHESPLPDLLPTLARYPEPPSKLHKGWEREATHDAGGTLEAQIYGRHSC